ncbi:site-specific integrase [Levilactobacillus brevis]|uniref:tyrosine-type recombinase/integrase n=1 Tax=Levilactobacillus brevis TaxID=1580 RepID=UPI000847DD75|nr:tyrosine-type recombinase/integrase [Levilactobacillus brevis]MCS8597081.1 site-specific integrase [Levilactobacillus brevis]NRD28647.1 site-specific integrase [Levilactobacillus brevis]ODP93885.1 hypothetical protein BGC39_05640 [Levilactobacillus brevis]
MANFKQYTKTNGTKAWEYTLSLGFDPASGKRVRSHKRGFQSKKEAQIAAGREESSVYDHGIKSGRKQSFQEVYDLFMVQYQKTVKSSTLRKALGFYRNHILPAFGKKDIKKVTPLQCQHVINDWSKSIQDPKKVMNYASKVFQYAMRMELIQRDPTKLITIPERKDKPTGDIDGNFYDKDELNLFFQCLNKERNEKAKTLFRILAYTGMRKGECLALKYSDIDFTTGTISITRTLSNGVDGLMLETPKTRASIRTIDIDPETLNVITRWRFTQKKAMLMLGFNIGNDPNQFVFTNNKNNLLTPSRTTIWLDQIINKYGLKRITTHGFRHTHASMLFEAGASIKQVQQRLGHADAQTTLNVYTHVSKHAKKDTINKFVKYMES